MDIVGRDDSNSDDSDSETEDEDDWDDEDDGTETWDLLDTTLGRLAQQVQGKLTLQLNIRCLGPEPAKFDHLLSRFLEYGILDVNSTQTSRTRGRLDLMRD